MWSKDGSGAWWKIKAWFQFVVYSMVVVLFVVWVALGSRTVSQQNKQILAQTQTQLDALQAQLSTVIQQNTIGDRTIVCILNVDPTKRTEKTTQRCEQQAELGRSSLP
jgi:hypothetical protein